MSRPHIPTPLAELGNRPFSLFPAIYNVEHNEWRLCRLEYNEAQIVNTKSPKEVWIPCRFVSGVSSIEEPVVIVGLRKELEIREGVVAPRVLRVIEMPRAVNDVPRWHAPDPEPGRLAPVVGIRVESPSAPPMARKHIVKIAAAVLAVMVGVTVLRIAPLGARGRFVSGASRIALPFTPTDHYISVVSRLGFPAETRAHTLSNGDEVHLLRYPGRGFTLVLGGEDREHARYLGAVGRGGRIVHSVRLQTGEDSAAMLSRLW